MRELTEFETAVSQALGAIPHGQASDGSECPARRDYHGIASGGFDLDYRCECDREQQIAQRVAEAIHMASCMGIAKALTLGLKYPNGNVPHGWDTPLIADSKAEGLRALSSLSGVTET